MMNVALAYISAPTRQMMKHMNKIAEAYPKSYHRLTGIAVLQIYTDVIHAITIN